MKLVANVERSTEATSHYEGRIGPDDGLSSSELPVPDSVQIEGRDGGWFLMYFDDRGDCLGDTWHMTLDDAKMQAEFEFGIRDDGWREAPWTEDS